MASYSDGSTQDVTPQATWLSSNVAVATVSTGGGNEGYALGVAPGTARITAAFSGKTGFATFTVSNATLSGLVIPPNPFTVPGRWPVTAPRHGHLQ